jgi:hypothetical protein
MKWVQTHPQVQIFDHEVCDLYDGKPAALAHKLYNDLPQGLYQRGFKCPGHFARRSMRFFRRYYGNTKLVVGLRHPIWWFESYYNFRNHHQREGMHLPDGETLIGECIPEAQGVCTDRANFHANLASFGKTNMSDPSERSLLRMRNKYQFISLIDNPVFLYDVGQLYDSDKKRSDIFKSDLQQFLGLDTPLDDFEDTSGGTKPKEKRMHICEDKYTDLRAELMANGKRASQWIRKYFLESDQVFVSSRDYFESILKEWENDPCLKKKASL